MLFTTSMFSREGWCVAGSDLTWGPETVRPTDGIHRLSSHPRAGSRADRELRCCSYVHIMEQFSHDQLPSGVNCHITSWPLALLWDGSSNTWGSCGQLQTSPTLFHFHTLFKSMKSSMHWITCCHWPMIYYIYNRCSIFHFLISSWTWARWLILTPHPYCGALSCTMDSGEGGLTSLGAQVSGVLTNFSILLQWNRTTARCVSEKDKAPLRD